MIRDDASQHAALAAHRFGLGEASLEAVGRDPQAWLVAQIGPAEVARGENLARLPEGLRAHVQLLRNQRQAADAGMAGAGNTMTAAEAAPGDPFRTIIQADVRSYLATGVVSSRPFAERLTRFWSNHFTVSVVKGNTRALVGAFEREAVRPHIAGTFETLLKAAVRHGAMVRYLDNDQSAGPRSRFVTTAARRAEAAGRPAPRITGLNENLAREVLELHTLGAASKAYGQADVTAFAAVLTGWRIPARIALQAEFADDEALTRFDPAWHEPGPKTVLGKTYREGPQALDEVLHDLSRHPATARFLALKLARHFVADEPPPALVDRLARAYADSQGDLPTVYRALVEAPESWQATPSKLKTPAEFITSTWRLLGTGDGPLQRFADGGAGAMGQRLHAAPSPAGWPDTADEWLGPDAMWKRVEWATRVADRFGRQVDARQLARQSLGPLLSATTAQQIERAADGPQALALLLLSPEFQRR